MELNKTENILVLDQQKAQKSKRNGELLLAFFLLAILIIQVQKKFLTQNNTKYKLFKSFVINMPCVILPIKTFLKYLSKSIKKLSFRLSVVL